jgi:hypothetical protein
LDINSTTDVDLAVCISDCPAKLLGDRGFGFRLLTVFTLSEGKKWFLC